MGRRPWLIAHVVSWSRWISRALQPRTKTFAGLPVLTLALGTTGVVARCRGDDSECAGIEEQLHHIQPWPQIPHESKREAPDSCGSQRAQSAAGQLLAMFVRPLLLLLDHGTVLPIFCGRMAWEASCTSAGRLELGPARVVVIASRPRSIANLLTHITTKILASRERMSAADTTVDQACALSRLERVCILQGLSMI